MPSTCIVCRQTGSSKNSVSMYRFPKDHVKRNEWLCALNLKEENVKEHHRVCSRHFLNGDMRQTPSLTIGAHFASPKRCIQIGIAEQKTIQPNEGS